MPPEMLGQLFRKHVAFTGGDAGRGTAASELGLAICKGLVEAHGGRIRAESAGLGQDARFTFTLPAAEGKAARAKARPAATRPPGEASAEPRILVVDDDPHTLRHVRDALAKAGYAVSVTAEPGEIADLIRAGRPQLVLLDLVLPGTGGIELMTEVAELSDLPVIFISGYGRDETIARAFEAEHRERPGRERHPVRAAGIVHTAPSRSICSHRAFRTSPERAAVSTRNSNASMAPEIRAGAAHPRERRPDLRVGQRAHVLLAYRGLRERRGEHVARGVVVAVPLRHRPLHDRADALAHPSGGHALGGPDGQQHRHDVGGGDGVDALASKARQDVVAHAGAPLALGAIALPVPGVDRDYGLIGFLEGGHLLHAPPGVAALGDGARVGERLLAGHGEGDHRDKSRGRGWSWRRWGR